MTITDRQLEAYYGGPWRSIWGQFRWHVAMKWACDWNPTALSRNVWFWWHELRGHFRHTENRRHWHTCPLPDDLPDEIDDTCLDDAMPRWLRIE